MYDRKKDPKEINNVYNDSKYAEVVHEMSQKFKDIRKEYKDSEALDNRYVEFYNTNSFELED